MYYNAAITANASNNSAAAARDDWHEHLNANIWIYVSPLIFFPGVIGNVLTMIVIRRPAFRNTTIGVYLLLTAVADIVVLLSGLLLDWLEAAEIPLKHLNVWSCRVVKFTLFTAGDVSIWLIVAFTTDRFVAVCFPLSKRFVCVPRRAAIASAIITFLAVSKNAHEFWTRDIQYIELTGVGRKQVCTIPSQFENFQNRVRPWLVFTFILTLPFVLILIFNCLIVRSLVLAQRMRAQHASGATSTSDATDGGQASASSYRQTTVMCLSASFAFLVCILPSIVLLIGRDYWGGRKAPPATRTAYRYAKLNNMLFYANHATNFILYCMTGSKFRDELKATFGRSADKASMDVQTHQLANNVR